MTKLLSQIITTATIICLVACNTASTDNKTSESSEAKEKTSFDLAAAKSTIEAMNAKEIDAFKKGDSTALASNYTQDAWILPPNSEAVKGNNIAAITALWGSFIRMGVKDLKLTSDEVSGNEEQLAETGKYETYDAENKLLDKGKYVIVWKPVNGTWKMYRDIWNSDMPAAGAK